MCSEPHDQPEPGTATGTVSIWRARNVGHTVHTTTWPRWSSALAVKASKCAGKGAAVETAFIQDFTACPNPPATTPLPHMGALTKIAP